MHVIAELSVVPIGENISASEHIAACERILQEAGLHVQLHAVGTNIEGDWDSVMPAIRRCHETMHEMGAGKISTTLRLDTRVGKPESMDERIESVRQKMKGAPAAG